MSGLFAGTMSFRGYFAASSLPGFPSPSSTVFSFACIVKEWSILRLGGALFSKYSSSISLYAPVPPTGHEQGSYRVVFSSAFLRPEVDPVGPKAARLLWPFIVGIFALLPSLASSYTPVPVLVLVPILVLVLVLVSVLVFPPTPSVQDFRRRPHVSIRHHTCHPPHASPSTHGRNRSS